MITRSASGPSRNFTPLILLAIVALILYGFGHTVGDTLFLTAKAPPTILYVHSLLSVAWLGLLVVQSTLVRTGNSAIHRRLGVWGLGFGVVLIAVGIWTAITMRHLHIEERGPSAAPGIAVALGTILLSFGTPLALAAYWRRKPALHRRLMLLSAIGLLPPGIARTPFAGIHLSDTHWVQVYFPVATLMLILFYGLAALQDVMANRRLHPVYAVGIPLGIAAKLFFTYLAVNPPDWWMSVSFGLAG